jgi:hypothetical protein
MPDALEYQQNQGIFQQNAPEFLIKFQMLD